MPEIRPEIRFYHLQTQSVDQALPGLAARAFEGGKRLALRLRDASEIKRVDEALWTFNPNSFIPHSASGDAADNPVWLQLGAANENSADTLISSVVDDTDYEGFSLICLMFEGRDEAALTAARARWKALKDSGAELTYWQQTPQGGWDKKA